MDYKSTTLNAFGMRKTLEGVKRDLAISLREARVGAGLSQEELAHEAEVDRTYVSQIERGVGNPSIGVLVRLALRLKTDVSELVRQR